MHHQRVNHVHLHVHHPYPPVAAGLHVESYARGENHQYQDGMHARGYVNHQHSHVQIDYNYQNDMYKLQTLGTMITQKNRLPGTSENYLQQQGKPGMGQIDYDHQNDMYKLQTLGTMITEKNRTMITEKNRLPGVSEYNLQQQGKPGMGLEFWDLSYSVTKKVKKDGKWVSRQVNLLNEISGQALKGQVTAVLGPSGAGKSTFLDALAGRIAKGSLQGNVSVEGKQITTSQMKKISSYVMQDDQLFPMLTVLETFMFAAEVRLAPSISRAQKRERVHQLLEQLGLQTATHTYIGDEGTRGVSGGERRRVSIGVDIIHGPSLLFLDEPTSGLDSTSAFTVVEKLKEIAKTGSIVIMTVHQPSYRIQELFNSMVILARGRLIYSGPPFELENYLAEFGREVPEGENGIEFLLDVIQEYDESTVGLDPLVQFQRYGKKPTEAMKTPVRRTPMNKRSVLRDNLASAIIPSNAGTETTSEIVYHEDEDEENFDNSLVRSTPLNNFRDPRLASSFYKNFSVWLYNEVKESVRGTPGPPNWAPPVMTITPGRTPMGPTPRRYPVYPQTPREFEYANKADADADTGTYSPPSEAESLSLSDGPKFANPWLREVGVLMWRNMLNIIRTPELFLSREIVFIVMSLMLSTLFKRLNRENSLVVANNLLNFYIFAVCLLFFSSNDAVPAFIQERYIYIRETSHNAYRASSYTIANLLVFLPFFAIQAMTFTVLTFFILKLNGAWWVFWLILYASLITTNSFVVFISAIVPNYITGYSMVIAATALFFLSCGFFLKRTHIPKPWLGLHYMSTIKYPFEALLINQFHPHDGFCYSRTDLPLAGPLGIITHASNVTRPQGCYAVGEDILKTMDISNKSILIDMGILLAWGFFYRLLFYVILRFYSKNQRK